MRWLLKRSSELPNSLSLLVYCDLVISPRTELPAKYLRLAERSGVVVRSGRGLYMPANAAVTELHTFAETAKRAPRGVICLLSALRFHDVGTQDPFEIWIAIGEKDR